MDIEEIAALYDTRVRNLGIGPKSVGWESAEQQKLRFNKLVHGLSLENVSVLDLGSGFGDFFSYLESQGTYISKYLGIEVSKEMLFAAQQQFEGNPRVSFSQADFLKYNSGSWDFVVASGSLNYRFGANMSEYLESVISKYSNICQKGLLINLLTDRVDYMQLQHAHYNPELVQHMMQKYFSSVIVIENYGLYEFTVQGLK
ncbi:AdoMet_MTases domain containing protein [Candidatus Nanopelagicaceae bacterium]